MVSFQRRAVLRRSAVRPAGVEHADRAWSDEVRLG
jgi:hypothetical protein